MGLAVLQGLTEHVVDEGVREAELCAYREAFRAHKLFQASEVERQGALRSLLAIWHTGGACRSAFEKGDELLLRGLIEVLPALCILEFQEMFSNADDLGCLLV